MYWYKWRTHLQCAEVAQAANGSGPCMKLPTNSLRMVESGISVPRELVQNWRELDGDSWTPLWMKKDPENKEYLVFDQV